MGADRRKTNWKVTLAYDGTDFHGWQIQPGSPTIQGTLASAIAAVTGEHTLPQGSGRTDAGVHAEGQVASFDLAAPIPKENLQRALNRILPQSIRVLSAEHAPPGFHARHSALAKTYEYRIFLGPVCPPLLSRYVMSCDPALDFDAMLQAASAVLGVHDFTSFAASDPDRTSRMAQLPPMQVGDALGCEKSHLPQAARSERTGNIRRVEVSQWSRAEVSHSNAGSVLPPGGQLWIYTVRGNGFLHHMVRNLVGTFLEIGHKRLNLSAIPDILAARDRSLAGPTAAARGLCLVNVFYGLPGPVESSADSQ